MLVDDLILTKSLGKGSFGEVFLTTKKGCKEIYATKRLDRKFSEKPDNMKRLANEINILRQINHPNIVKLIELKKTKTHIYIITEFCNGGSLTDCLRDYINSHYKPFSEKIVQYLMKQILSAINYLHSKKIIHRDLKLDNILVNFPSEQDKKSLNMMSAVTKLIDFGFATKLRSSKANLTYTVLGTPTYMEPHLLKNMETKTQNYRGYDEKADIWSLGALCYEMLEGRMSFGGRSMEELYQKVKDGNYSLPLTSSKEVASFINGMLQYDPNKRLTASELLNHDFIVKNVNDFTPIDQNKLENKIIGNALNINIKDNKTICAVFNKDNDTQKIIRNNNTNTNNTNNMVYYNTYNTENNNAKIENKNIEIVHKQMPIEYGNNQKKVRIAQNVKPVEHHNNQNVKKDKYAKVVRVVQQNANNNQMNGNNLYNQYGIFPKPEITHQNQQNQETWKNPYNTNNYLQQYSQQPISYNNFQDNQNYNF